MNHPHGNTLKVIDINTGMYRLPARKTPKLCTVSVIVMGLLSTGFAFLVDQFPGSIVQVRSMSTLTRAVVKVSAFSIRWRLLANV